MKYRSAHRPGAVDVLDIETDSVRKLGNRLVGILHGCLKAHPRYDEATAWAHWNTVAA